VIIFAPAGVARGFPDFFLVQPWLETLAAYFLSITMEAVPFLLLGALLTAVMEVFLSPSLLPRLTAKLGPWGVPVTALLSPLFPVCDCAVVVVAKGLMRKGLPLPHAITYLLAAPILNPAVFLSTWLAFGNLRYPLARTLGGLVVPIILGLLVSKLRPEQVLLPGALAEAEGNAWPVGLPLQIQPEPVGLVQPGSMLRTPLAEPACGCGHVQVPGQARPVLNLASHIAADFLDMMPYFLTGVFLASAAKTFLAGDILDNLGAGPVAGPLTMMAAAFIFSVCSEADAFAAVSFREFNFASHQAFLVLGPMLDIKQVLMYRSIFRGWFVGLLALGICLGVGAYVALLAVLR
jgi:uncharacterized membrane protein YraQ (UPF0718 family)